MQDRYAGDIGDFGKFALLRALSPGRRLGVCWYRFDGRAESNNDGRHVAYLDEPARLRGLDPPLFDRLRRYLDDVRLGSVTRNVAGLEALGLLDESTRFHSPFCPTSRLERARWFETLVGAMEEADLLFFDPDNGIETARLSAKSIAISELNALQRPGRALLVYHHQTRMRGGARAEFESIRFRLVDAGFSSVQAVRLRPYSSRFYFLLDGDSELGIRFAEFARLWGNRGELFLPSTSA